MRTCNCAILYVHSSNYLSLRSDTPNLYDWFFLLFMAGLGLTLNSFYIEYTNTKKLPQLLLLHISSVCECVAAALVTLLLFDPIGQLTLTSCRPTKLKVCFQCINKPTNVLVCNPLLVFTSCHCRNVVQR